MNLTRSQMNLLTPSEIEAVELSKQDKNLTIQQAKDFNSSMEKIHQENLEIKWRVNRMHQINMLKNAKKMMQKLRFRNFHK